MSGRKVRAELWDIAWTEDDDELETWCDEHGCAPDTLPLRAEASSEERWHHFVNEIKKFAISLQNNENFCALIKHVVPPYDFKKNWAVMPNGKICVAG